MMMWRRDEKREERLTLSLQQLGTRIKDLYERYKLSIS
jgi:hypothetical protein